MSKVEIFLAIVIFCLAIVATPLAWESITQTGIGFESLFGVYITGCLWYALYLILVSRIISDKSLEKKRNEELYREMSDARLSTLFHEEMNKKSKKE